MDDVIRQRIKYLVEHGEVYPTKQETSVQYRRIWIAITVLGLLQLIDMTIGYLR